MLIDYDIVDNNDSNNYYYKIALLTLATSKQRDNWVTIKDSYLFNMTLKTFLLTMDKEHDYQVYIGIDKNDRIFDKTDQQDEITRFSKVFPNVEIIFITMENIEKGYVTLMWNKIFQEAYNNKCDYFYQCGDDMAFRTKGWINDCIKVLKSKNDIGLAGPINNNNRILTQALYRENIWKYLDGFFQKK